MNRTFAVMFPLLIAILFSSAACKTTTEKALDKRGTVHVAEPGDKKDKKSKKKDKDAADMASRTAPYGIGGGSAALGRNPDMTIPRGSVSGSSVTYSRVNINEPFIAMTFDDGPHASNTPRLLDMLRQRNIKATFYVIGENARRYPNILRRMINEGHEIGNHTESHAYLTKLSDNGVRKELNSCREAIIAATGVAPVTMRPPYGAISSRQKSWIHQEWGYPSIMWSVDPNDWKRPGPSVVASRLISGAGSGGILLAHDIHKGTIDAMPEALDRLLAKGYRFVTVSQLIRLGQRGSGMSMSAEGGEESGPEPAPGLDPELKPEPVPESSVALAR
jgi:peptidoglycan/xylan/chitin deacetylase (PgdA/CDA1 family)